MGKVGRNFLIHHRKSIFKVAPEHLRHATNEERMVAQTEGRELLGVKDLINPENRKQLGSQVVDLTGQPSPEESMRQSQSTNPLAVDHWLQRGDLLCRVHKCARMETFMPDPEDPVVKRFHFDDWRLTKINGREEPVIHHPLSNPSCAQVCIQEEPWTGDSQFRVHGSRLTPNNAAPSEFVIPSSSTERPSSEDAPEVNPGPRVVPYESGAVPVTDSGSSTYGPIRVRQSKGPDTFLLRPPGTEIEDLRDIIQESHGTKRASSREPSADPPAKAARTEEEDCLLAEHSKVEHVEVLIANFLKKKMQKELHHSNNPPSLQELVDSSKIAEWNTLRDEKQAIKVILPKAAAKIRREQPNRIMTSRFVVTEKHEDGETKVKSRWCLRGHHDPDLVQKVLAGKCHSPTLSQFGRSLILQLLVSNRWRMNLGDIKGAFLEADVRQKAAANPVFSELPPGGVPGVPQGSLVQVLGNIYGANDAPQEWYHEFDTTAIACGFQRSKFDSCLYYCVGDDNELQGVLGAHVDDTITGGSGSKYDQAVSMLRERFPFRKWRTGSGEFLGTVYEQCPEDFTITFSQKDYAEHIRPIAISKERSKKPWLPATDREVAALRAVNGALGWLSSQSRPDLSVQTSLSQQCFPNPTVFNLMQANQAVRRAKQQSDLRITVPFIRPEDLTLCFWSDAAFANTTDMRTQAGWIVGFTSKEMSQGMDVPVFCFSWKSYRLPRVVSSTLGGEAQAFATASGVCEWISLMLAEALDGPFELDQIEHVLSKRNPIGISDCRSLYDHLISLTSNNSVDDKRTAIDIAVIRQSIKRSGLEPRWCATGHMVADGLTKDKAEPADLLRSVLRNSRYQLADEQLVLDRKREEKEHRRHRAASRAQLSAPTN